MLGNNMIAFGQNNYNINNTVWPLLQEILFYVLSSKLHKHVAIQSQACDGS